MCAYQGVKNVSFSENFAYVLNRWAVSHLPILLEFKFLLIIERLCKTTQTALILITFPTVSIIFRYLEAGY